MFIDKMIGGKFAREQAKTISSAAGKEFLQDPWLAYCHIRGLTV